MPPRSEASGDAESGRGLKASEVNLQRDIRQLPKLSPTYPAYDLQSINRPVKVPTNQRNPPPPTPTTIKIY